VPVAAATLAPRKPEDQHDQHDRPQTPRRMARERQGAASAPAARVSSRLDQLEQLLVCETGVSIAEMVDATGWQQHSVRGAIAGALKKRGLEITSDKVDGVRRYRASQPA